MAPSRRIGIIGAGPGGICAGVRLRQAGYDDFVVLEQAGGPGGTWWHNRYPGLACDVPSLLYSFSFEPKYDWSRPYGTQAEIQAYMRDVVHRHGLEPHIRYDTRVGAARWDDDRSVWRLETASGETLEVDVVISALGMFNEPSWPDIEGLEGFGGTTFHSARWDRDHDLRGERVAVIGSAASAVQLVPEIAKVVGRLHLFQRAANWVSPKEDDPYSPEQIEWFRTHPEDVAALREEIFRRMDPVLTFSDPDVVRASTERALRNLAVVEDPDVRRKLTPTVPYGCQRPLVSNDYYPTFNRPNVELVTERIDHVTTDAVVTVDGVARTVDTIVVATGFATTRFLSAIEVTGRGGRRLDDAWADGARAYLGITTAGFPNLFMLYGPNTNNGSILYMIEAQVDYALRQLRRLDDEHLAWVDVRPEAEERYNEELQATMEAVTAWSAGGCHNYYRGPSGRIVTQWPGSMSGYRARTEVPDADAYEVAPAAPAPVTG